jgi:uncharacterized membrane protein YfcA
LVLAARRADGVRRLPARATSGSLLVFALDRRTHGFGLIVHFITFVALGGIFGFVGGLFGIGGAFLAIPVLGIAFGLNEQTAQGTALAMGTPNVIVGLWSYSRKARLDWRLAVTLAVTALPFSFGAARIATLLPSGSLRIAFSIFLVAIALDLARRTFLAQAPQMAALPWPFATIAGAIGGVFSGFFGIGGAILTVPAMTMFFGQSQVEGQGLALAFAVPTTILTTATYALASDVDWAAGIPLALGGVATVSLGVDLAHRLPERVLRSLFIGFIVVVAVALFVKARITGT